MDLISKSKHDPYGEEKMFLSFDFFEFLQKEYSIKFDSNNTIDLGGSYSRNILLPTTKGKYVARAYQPYQTISRVKNVQAVRNFLYKKGIPTTETIPTKFEKCYTEYKGNIVEVEKFVETEKMSPMNSWEKIEIGMKTLAHIHIHTPHFNLENSGKYPLVSNHVDIEYALAWTKRGVDSIRKHAVFGVKMENGIENVLKLALYIDKNERDLYKNIKRSLAHGDYWDNNVYIKNSKVSSVMDFDFMGKRPRIDDIAYTIFQMIHQKPYSMDVFPQIVTILQRYQSAHSENFSADEIQLFPLSIARVPLAFIGIIASLNTSDEMKKEFLKRVNEIEFSLRIIEDISHWREYLFENIYATL